jgi:hypothetical protein
VSSPSIEPPGRDRRPNDGDDDPLPQEFELPPAELRFEGVPPTIEPGPTPGTVRTRVRVPDGSTTTDPQASFRQGITYDLSVGGDVGVSGALDVTEQPDVLDAQGVMEADNDQVITGTLYSGVTVAAGEVGQTVDPGFPIDPARSGTRRDRASRRDGRSGSRDRAAPARTRTA